MTAIEFLRTKKILGATNTEWIVRFPETGLEFSVVKMLEEYARLKKNEPGTPSEGNAHELHGYNTELLD